MATDIAREYAHRADKAARYSAHFFAAGIRSSQVALMDVHHPAWADLARAISKESGRRLLPPHSQATIDAVVRELGYYEDARAGRERAADVPFDVRF